MINIIIIDAFIFLFNFLVHSTHTSNWNVRAGSSNYNSGGQVARVKTIIEHNEFNDILRFNDISLLLLQSGLTLGTNIEVIKINFEPISIGSERFKNNMPKIPNDDPMTKQMMMAMPAMMTTIMTTMAKKMTTMPTMMTTMATMPTKMTTMTTKEPPPNNPNKIEVIATGWGSNNWVIFFLFGFSIYTFQRYKLLYSNNFTDKLVLIKFTAND